VPNLNPQTEKLLDPMIFYPDTARVLGSVSSKDQGFDAQMSGIKIYKGDEILRPVYKKTFFLKYCVVACIFELFCS
jgi:hypothetical protein